MAGNELKFGIGHSTVPGEPSDTLMPERMGSRFDPGKFGVFLHDLLHPSRGEFAIPPGLEEPAIVRMGRDMSSQGRCEGLAKQDIPISKVKTMALAFFSPNCLQRV